MTEYNRTSDKLAEIDLALKNLAAGLIDPEKFRDDTKLMSVVEIVKIQKELGDIVSCAEEVKTAVQKLYDFTRYTRVPEIMEENEVESLQVEGVGKVYLTSDMNVSVKSGMKEDAMDWLVENGFGDIISETVNSSTLKAVIKKEVIGKGKEAPENLFNINPFTRSAIRKS